MGMARYAISGEEGEWHVEHDGQVAHTYETKERLLRPLLRLHL